MSEWITDRAPMESDANEGYVWFCDIDGYVGRLPWRIVVCRKGTAWMPITKPEPYVKPKRIFVVWSELFNCWALRELPKGGTILLGDTVLNVGLIKKNEQHREAAERIAAIYEEVMP